MIRLEQTAAQMEAGTVAVRGRIASQRAATGMPAPDSEVRSEDSLDRLLESQLGGKPKTAG